MGSQCTRLSFEEFTPESLQALIDLTLSLSRTRRTQALSELEDCSIAIEATYYLRLFLDNRPYHEPLLPALGGLTGIQTHLEQDLKLFQENKIIPFFIFDGQVIVGQDDVTARRGRQAIQKTNEAWSLYFNGNANQAVDTFGANLGKGWQAWPERVTGMVC